MPEKEISISRETISLETRSEPEIAGTTWASTG